MNITWEHVYTMVQDLIESYDSMNSMDEIHDYCDEIRDSIADALEEAGVPVRYTERIFRSMLGENAEIAMSAAEAAGYPWAAIG